MEVVSVTFKTREELKKGDLPDKPKEKRDVEFNLMATDQSDSMVLRAERGRS
jgi:hypothetical protein